MLEKIQNLLQTPSGKSFGIGFAIVAVCAAYYFVRISAGGIENPNTRVFIDAETGSVFRHEMSLGETVPVYSSSSGKGNGYPAEACFWNADGSIKSSPTWVLMNQYVHKSGPTFCPDCGRLVTPQSGTPTAASSAPPTQAEYPAYEKKLRAEARNEH